jgi:hypothetical protein
MIRTFEGVTISQTASELEESVGGKKTDRTEGRVGTSAFPIPDAVGSSRSRDGCHPPRNETLAESEGEMIDMELEHMR